MVLIGGLFIPIELKRGKSVVAHLRPSQKSWHKLSLSLGGRTYGATLVADPEGDQVILFELKLPGGSLSGKLEEVELWRFSLLQFNYASLVRFYVMSHK
jgi:hypothetical protein